MSNGTMRQFTASWHLGAKLPAFSDAVIEAEPMLFGADFAFAEMHGGPITRSILNHLDSSEEWLIDTRVHMLKQGWYPAIPGWHLDFIPRSKTNRQPDFTQDVAGLSYVTAIVGGGSATEFLERGSTARLWCRDGKRWSEFSKEINSAILDGELSCERIPFGQIVHFGPSDFHRASPSTGDAWRFFIRASKGSGVHPTPKVRRQTQVYLHELEAGW